MPVAVKFSQDFYDRFGHKAVDELVNYLNRIDTGYRTELKELNEANFARFDDKLERRIAELKAELAERFASTDHRVEQIGKEIEAVRADVIKWMFVFWMGTLVPLAGLMVVLTRR